MDRQHLVVKLRRGFRRFERRSKARIYWRISSMIRGLPLFSGRLWDAIKTRGVGDSIFAISERTLAMIRLQLALRFFRKRVSPFGSR